MSRRHHHHALTLLALALVLGCGGCTPDRDVTPGLLVGRDGTILAATPGHVRRVEEERLQHAIAAMVDPDWGVDVAILDNPYSFDDERFFWESVTVEVRLQSPSPEQRRPSLPLAEIARRVQRQLAGHTRTGEGPRVRIAIHPAAADVTGS